MIGAPYTVTKDLMQHFKVDVVCHGSTPIALENGTHDSYAVPKTMGKFVLLDSGKYSHSHWDRKFKTFRPEYILIKIKTDFFFVAGNDMTTEKIVERIIKHRLEFEQRNLKKEKKELEIMEAFQKNKSTQKAG